MSSSSRLGFLARDLLYLWEDMGGHGTLLIANWKSLCRSESLRPGATLQELIDDATPDGVIVDRSNRVQAILPMKDMTAESHRNHSLFAFHQLGIQIVCWGRKHKKT